MYKKISRILLMGLVSLSLVACGSKDSAKNESSSNEKSEVKSEVSSTENSNEKLSISELNISYVTSPLNVPSIVERQKKIFEQELPGVKVNYFEITSGAEQTEALASGDLDMLYAVGASSVILAKSNGLDIKVLDMYSRAPKAFAMYANDDSLKDPENIKGKRIAGPVGTNLHQLLVAHLEKNNMTLDDVDFVNMSIPDAQAALENKSIDVALLGGPASYQAEKNGKYLVADGEGLIDAIISVATSEKFAKEHPDVIEKIKEADNKIRSFMAENPDETKKLVEKELSLDDESYEDMLKLYDFSTAITEKDKEGYQKTADFMKNTDMIENDVDIDSLF